uniref:Uncharacterized protein n=1 Tax=Physcomitrium patens TaxID=3218 RepID=A0A2K1KIC2_PHYPA|nr:hypothetical protein PHYPA_007194 [Physcomitrium patens]
MVYRVCRRMAMMTMAAASTEMKMATVAVDCLQMFAMVRRYLLWEASLMAWMITSCLSRMAMLVSMVTRLHKVRMDSPSPPKQSMSFGRQRRLLEEKEQKRAGLKTTLLILPTTDWRLMPRRYSVWTMSNLQLTRVTQSELTGRPDVLIAAVPACTWPVGDLALSRLRDTSFLWRYLNVPKKVKK